MATSISTTRRLFLSFVALLASLLSPFSASALDKPAYAASLESEGDLYRAIGLWKEIRFEATSADIYWTASQSILVDLWRSKQYEIALSEVRRLRAAAQTLSSQRTEQLATWEGILDYRLNRFGAAEYSFSQTNNLLYTGLLLAKTGRGDQAQWQGLELPDPTALGERRSPLAAALFSTVLPGSGQIYSGHWYDGIQAAAFTGFFGLAAYGTYLYDSKFSSNYALTGMAVAVAAIFYASNIYGATKTADYFNQNQFNSQMDKLDNAVFSRPLPDVGSQPKP